MQLAFSKRGVFSGILRFVNLLFGSPAALAFFRFVKTIWSEVLLNHGCVRFGDAPPADN
jgi:hypothetical protein